MKMLPRAACLLLATAACAPALAQIAPPSLTGLPSVAAPAAGDFVEVIGTAGRRVVPATALGGGAGLTAGTITSLPAPSTALTGSEGSACVQGGQLVQCNPALQSAYTLGAGITGLGAANPLTGTETNNLVQGGVAVKAPLSAIAGYSLGTAAAALPAAGAFNGTESITGLQGGAPVRFSPAQQAGYTLTTGVTAATAATGSLAGTESVPAVTAGGVQTRITPAQVGALAFSATMPALTAAATAAGSEGVPLVQNGAPVLGTINGSIAPNARPNIYNYTPAGLIKWRAALAKAVTGQAWAKLVTYTDSIGAGGGAGTAGTTMMTGAFTRSFPAWMAKLFPSGPTVTYEAIFGDHVTPDTGSAAVAAYYGNVTFSGTTDWTRSTPTMGGNALQNPSANGNGTITITPRTPVDTVDVWSLTSGSSGSFTVSDANGTMCTVNAASGAAYKKNTCARVSGGPSTLPITLAKSATGDLGIGGFDLYNSTAPGVRIINAGAYGQTTVTEAGTALGYSPLSALKAYAPDFCVIELGGNDYRNSTGAAAYQTALTNIVQGCQLTGSAMIVWLNPDSSYSDAIRAPYRAVAYSVAVATGVPLLDMGERFINATQMSANGFLYDSVHPTQPGHVDYATALLPFLRP